MNNQLIVIGRIGEQPTTINFADTGNRLVKFCVAVPVFTQKKEEKQTMWLDVDAWNGVADRALQLLTKGREVVLYGRLAISTYTKDVRGEKVKMKNPVLKLTDFHLCDKKPDPNRKASQEPQA